MSLRGADCARLLIRATKRLFDRMAWQFSPRPSVVFRDRSLRTGRLRGKLAEPPKAVGQFTPIFAAAQPCCARPARQFDAGAQGETKTPTSPAPVKSGIAFEG